jgi:hypothetical protein
MIHLILLVALYFLPTIIANQRHLDSRAGIILLNLFLGWTFVGWIVALIWAIAAAPPYMTYMPPTHPRYYR